MSVGDSEGFHALRLDNGEQCLHGVSRVNDVLHNEDMPVLQDIEVDAVDFDCASLASNTPTISRRFGTVVALHLHKLVRKAHSQLLHVAREGRKESVRTLNTNKDREQVPSECRSSECVHCRSRASDRRRVWRCDPRSFRSSSECHPTCPSDEWPCEYALCTLPE